MSATALELAHTRALSIQATKTQLSELDMAFAQQSERAFERIDQVLRMMADSVAEAPNVLLDQPERTSAFLQRRIYGVTQLAGLAFADPAGRIVAASFPVMSEAFRSEAEGALHAALGDRAMLRIGKPFDYGGRPSLSLMTRRIDDGDGRLLGFAVAFVNSGFFHRIFEAVQLDRKTVITLYLEDGTVLARAPRALGGVGVSAAEAPPFGAGSTKAELVKADEGIEVHGATADAAARIVAVHALQILPVALSVAVQEPDVLQAWTDEAVAVGTIALTGSLLSFGLLLSLARRSEDREVLVQALADAKDAALDSHGRLAEQMAERERAEDALRKTQRIEAVGQLTGGVAHDFNNLLTVVLSNIEMLQSGDVCRADRQQMLGDARAAAERGAVMTGQLLAFSRQQPLRPAALDTRALIGGMTKLLQTALGGGVTLELQLHTRWAALADPNQIELVFVNLALNAGDAMPGGGTLTIEARDVVRGAPELPEQPPAGEYVMIAFGDTGTGMSAEVRCRAFEPFFTTKGPASRSGLGLSQAYGVVRQLGGLMELESTPGKGTKVLLWLPRADIPAAVAVPAPQPAAASIASRPTILVVDDDHAVRAATIRMLRRAGYEVLEDHSAEPALQRLSAGEEVHMVLTDIVMPGMSGLELARAARQVRPSTPFVFMSGYADPGDVAAELGPLTLIRKPFRAADLVRHVAAALDGCGTEGGPARVRHGS